MLLKCVAVSALLFLTACQRSAVLDELREIKEAVCECPDTACIDALRASTKPLENRLKNLSAEDQKTANQLAIEIMACQTQAK